MINESTLIPIGAASGFAFLVLMSVRWLDARFNKITAAIDKALKDRWTRTDHRLWALELQVQNPSLKIPVSQVSPQENEGFTLGD